MTTGAVVLRQPFGGMGQSVFGPGMKAGGPNYVAQLMEFQDRPVLSFHGDIDPDLDREPITDPLLAEMAGRLRMDRPRIPGAAPGETDRVLAAIPSYQRALNEELGREHDHFRLVGRDNVRRYFPVRDLRIRLHAEDGLFNLIARIAAARTLGCHITLSIPCHVAVRGLSWLRRAIASSNDSIDLVEEDDHRLAEISRAGGTDRVRFAAPDRVALEILSAAARTSIYIARAPVSAEGRVDLLWYLREQSVSYDYHRYGNLGSRSSEQRAPVP